MNATQALKDALKAVDDAQLPDDLRVIGFERALAIVLGETVTPQHSDSNDDTGAKVPPHDDGSKLMTVATEFGLPIDQIDRLFDEHEGNLQFVGDVGVFGKTNAAKVSGLATILMAARQAAKYDDGPTPDSVVRQEVDRHGIFDSGNYNKHTSTLKPYFNVNGSGKSATYKVKYEGRQRAKELAKLITGG